MGKYVFKTSRAGYKVSTALPRFLTVNSDKNQFKVISSGSGTLSLSSTNSWDTYVDIAHSLGYKPFVLAWHTDRNGKWVRFPYYEGGSGVYGPSGGIVSLIDHTSTNNTRLRVYEQEDWETWPADTNPSDVTVKYKYLIFVDPLTEAWYE
jgi:hypothetical protein